MTKRIVSCNAGKREHLDIEGRRIYTGIFKRPVEGPLVLEPGGVKGDHVDNLKVHGGPKKAVYLYPSEHYPYWAQKLEKDNLPWGTLGENLTTEGFDETNVHIGDRLRIGDVVLQVTKHRGPCFKLAAKFGTKQAINWMIESGTFGFYAAVIEPGEVRAGDVIEVVDTVPSAPTVREVGQRDYA